MLKARYPVNIPDSCASIDGSDFTRKINLSNYQGFIRVRCIALCNLDNSGVRVNVGYMHGTSAYYFDTIVLTNDSYFYKTLPDILLYPSDYIVIKFISPNAGDKFLINIMTDEEIYEG